MGLDAPQSRQMIRKNNVECMNKKTADEQMLNTCLVVEHFGISRTEIIRENKQ